MHINAKLQIRFSANEDTFNNLTSLFNIQPTDTFNDFHNGIPTCWIYEITQDSPDRHFDFINILMDILEPKFSELEALNIKREDISIWMLYEYHQQCNVELDPQRLKRLGDNGITFCISCWES